MNLHSFFEAVGSVGLFAAAGFLWKISAAFTRVETSVEDIKTNHLPHLQNDIATLRQAFIDFLVEGTKK